ncbi:MAG TPA: Phenylacetic acid catabolic protein [Chloroflexota bacterium]|jgi:1,2-phenylacetyl-CoA epoxidase catalytic subunit|nr:Phenylacetic acid catabolic protein [Chloroflexota bacterium]
MITREIQWGQYEGIRKFEGPQELPEEYAKFLKRLLFVQADTEFASVQQHRPWLDRAPTLEDRWTEARILADEMRHGYQICKLLEDFGPEGQEMVQKLLNMRMGEHKLDSFNMEFETWEDVLAFTALVDRVGIFQLRSFQECSYGPLARAIPLMLAEEQLHIGFGANGLKRMVNDPNYYGDRELAQKAVNKWFPRALDMFGHSGSEGSELAVRLGIKRWRNEEAREEYLKDVKRMLEGAGLEMPDPLKDRRVL